MKSYHSPVLGKDTIVDHIIEPKEKYPPVLPYFIIIRFLEVGASEDDAIYKSKYMKLNKIK